MTELSGDLAELCRSVGLEISYLGWRGEPVVSKPEAVLALLATLGKGFGFELSGLSDVRQATAIVGQNRWKSGPPVAVAWNGRGEVSLPVPASQDGDWELELFCESGRREIRRGRMFDLPAAGHTEVDRVTMCRRSIELPLAGELGYHRAQWSALGQSGTCEVIAAPERAASRPGTRSWGIFAPLYGVRSSRSGATGDLDTMQAMRDWVHRRGGSYVATLPILAQFLEEPYSISPYGPASRLFWNELYVAMRPPAVLGSSVAAELNEAAGSFTEERDRLARLPVIEYRGQYAWKRAWIDKVAAACAVHPAARASVEQWAATVPVFDYAMFRAFCEMEGRGWHTWATPRDGIEQASSLEDATRLGADPVRVWSHVVAQWMMHEQLVSAGKRDADAATAGIYLDLPVGVSGDAYEVWRHRDLFARRASVGAPPDELFLGGQEWGLPPIHPQMSRASGHRYIRDSLRHHMQAASMLRIDHVMGLHRLYCVPRGFGATDGAYLRYPKDELYALVTLESHRHACSVVGEDLGTVPEDVPPALQRHNITRLWVSQFEIPSEVGKAPKTSPESVVASFGTHDMASFSGWWNGADIADRQALGLIGAVEERRQQAHRLEERRALLAFVDTHQLAAADLPDEARAMVGVTVNLARGPSDVVLVTLEDLWLEPLPQNVPGTSHERPNWLRPLALDAEQLGFEGSGEPAASAGLSVIDDVAQARLAPPISTP